MVTVATPSVHLSSESRGGLDQVQAGGALTPNSLEMRLENET